MKARTKRMLKSIFNVIKKPEMRILPGQLSFFFLMSLIPLVALIGAIASSFHISLSTLEDIFAISIPVAVKEALGLFTIGKSVGVNMVVFYISAFILASNGTHSMIIASNSIYKFKDKDYLSRKLKAIMMTFILVLLLTFLLVVPVFGDFIVGLVEKALGASTSTKVINIFYQIFKYPISLMFIFISIKLLYTMAPDKKIESSTTTKGAIFTTVIWIVASEIYSIYIGVFNKYDLFYGSVANILILMLWIYILSYVFVLGMALNANTYEKEKSLIDKIINK